MSHAFRIKKVAVLGSGTMGSTIACHLANCGFDVLLLDMVPVGLTGDQKNNPKERNKLVNHSLETAIKSKPSPVFTKNVVQKITTGNFDDDLEKIKGVDWIIEVIIENLNIKKGLFTNIDLFRRKDAIVSSNTSSIPIHQLVEGRSESFKKHFLGTHFFNPPRYLPLLEIIPHAETDPVVSKFMLGFGEENLGKTTVLCKDTPAFIANRIGVYSMGVVYNLAQELDLDIKEVDKLTGPALARPNTGTFRLSDMVGLDVANKVVSVIKENCPDDQMAQSLQMPDYFTYLLDNKWYGTKSGQGFYKKTSEKDDKGKSIILGLNLKTKEYENIPSSKLASLSMSKQMENPVKRIQALFDHEDKGGKLVRKSLAYLFSYVSHRIPEIADDLYWIDRAMKAGFAWKYGPFEYWDIIGLDKGIKAVQEEGLTVAPWVEKMMASGKTSFYNIDNNVTSYFSISSGDYMPVPGAEEFIILSNQTSAPVLKNDELTVHDLGDGVMCAEFTSKANTIGSGIIEGINEAITKAEEEGWNGLVIGNNADNFSVGANLMLIGMLAFQQEYQQLNMAIKMFQDMTMRCRYSKIPVVSATQGYVFGGGCETQMHCDSTIAAAESYIGLVEAGVGVIPGGGGTKEFSVRLSDEFIKDGVHIPQLIERFRTIATAAVGTSAGEAFGLGYLEEKDEVCLNKFKNISRAKEKVLELSNNYVQPSKRSDVYVLGRSGLAALQLAANELKLGGYASEYDIHIANKMAFVLCGGDLSTPQYVTEDYLLDLEREAFMSLCGEQKTLERIQYMLENNKPLRN